MDKQPKTYYVTAKKTVTLARDKSVKHTQTLNLAVVVMSKKELPSMLESIGVKAKQVVEIGGEVINITHKVLQITLLNAGLHFGNSVLQKAAEVNLIHNITNNKN